MLEPDRDRRRKDHAMPAPQPTTHTSNPNIIPSASGFEHSWDIVDAQVRFSYFLRADYRDPELDHVARSVKLSPNGRGLRIAILGPYGEDHAAFGEGKFHPVFDAARKHELPVFILAPGQAKDINFHATEYPDVTIVLDHTGMRLPDGSGDTDLAAFDDVLALSTNRNIALK
jgi:predicted TIM-barrel fold metal-dependent hydrolase